jgi:hypothetical protein
VLQQTEQLHLFSFTTTMHSLIVPANQLNRRAIPPAGEAQTQIAVLLQKAAVLHLVGSSFGY